LKFSRVHSIFLASISALLVFSCPNPNYVWLFDKDNSKDDGTHSVITQVAAPTAIPGAGIYSEAKTVTLSSRTSEASIYYTFDGSVPSKNSTPYTTPITVPMNTTLKAIAIKEDMRDSELLEAVYIQMESPTITIPTVNALDLSSVVTAPVKDTAPDRTVIDTSQYTGTVDWETEAGDPVTGNFAGSSIYKAIVTLTAKEGRVFSGIAENAFSYNNASAANAPDSGIVTITFLPTAADDAVSTLDTPANFAATPGVLGNIEFSWNAVSGATGYSIYQAASSGGSYSTVAEGIATTSYSYTGATLGTAFYYKIRAVYSQWGLIPRRLRRFCSKPHKYNNFLSERASVA
jgi:hypothetical protein